MKEAGLNRHLLSFRWGRTAREHWTPSCGPRGGAGAPDAATKGRIPRAGAQSLSVSPTALITLGAKLAKRDLVLKGNTPLHAR